jgi:hypothetical protein
MPGIVYAEGHRLRQVALRVRYQRKCRLGSARLVWMLRADPLDTTSAVADSTAIRADAPAVGVFARRGALPCSRQGARIRADAPAVGVFASQAECISETPVYRSGHGIWRYSLPRGNGPCMIIRRNRAPVISPEYATVFATSQRIGWLTQEGEP